MRSLSCRWSAGANPELLIGEHVKAAPLIREYGIETIPTGYMLVESGTLTSVEFMSDTRPIPRDKIDIAMAHALAGRVLGHAAYLSRDWQRRMRFCARRNGERGSRLCLSAGRRRRRHPRPGVARAKVEARCGLCPSRVSVVEDDQQRLCTLSRAVHAKETGVVMGHG